MARGTEIVLHLKEDAKRFLETLRDRARDQDLLRPHPVPDRARRCQDGDAAPDQRGERALAPAEIGAQAEDYTQAYHAIAGAFDEPALTLHYKAEGRQSYAVLLFVPSAAAVRPVRPGAQGPREALCAARLHHRRRRAAAVLSALHARRGRQRGHAAQHLARDAAEQSAGRADPQGADQPRHHRAGDPRREGAGDVRQDLGGVRPRPQGGSLRDHERREQLLALSRFSTTAGESLARSSNTSPISSRTRPKSTISSATAPSA